MQSLVAQRNLNTATNSLSESTQKLSTGKKINKAADDAAGLFIAKGIESQLRGSQQCQNNIALGVNVLQIAEGDLGTIQENVMRIKDLATQAANGIHSTDARNAMASEVKSRVAEIDRVANASTFNGTHLLNGTDSNLSNLRIQVGAGSDPGANAIFVSGVFVNSNSASIGLAANEAAVTSAFATATASAAFIATCEDVITDLSTKRANIGVIQSRLQMTGEGLATTIENLSAAKSTVMDTDIAATAAEMTKSQILQQISTSMLTQANQAPSIALSLLR